MGIAANGDAQIAVGGTELPRAAAPGTAVHHAQDTPLTLPCIAVIWCPIIAVMPTVLRPLPHIPQYVIKPEVVCPERPHGRRQTMVVVTSYFPIKVRAGVCPIGMKALLPGALPPITGRSRSSTRHVLPLRFAQQPVALARLLRQPSHVRPRVVPPKRTPPDAAPSARSRGSARCDLYAPTPLPGCSSPSRNEVPRASPTVQSGQTRPASPHAHPLQTARQSPRDGVALRHRHDLLHQPVNPSGTTSPAPPPSPDTWRNLESACQALAYANALLPPPEPPTQTAVPASSANL